MDFNQEIIHLISTKKIQNKKELHKQKIRLCKKYNLKTIPSDSTILASVSKKNPEYQKILSILRKKPMRTISGVSVVAVMTSPAPCPHGQCIPCPGGPTSDTPQSYTGEEPAALRAALNQYDPYLQTKNRLQQLQAIGHPINKIDLIIMGGTFTARDFLYQQWFIKRCFDAMNNTFSQNLFEAQLQNQKASSRCIGVTIETRPDWFQLSHIDNALSYGSTRVELGVQGIYDDVLHYMKRGHTVADTIQATHRAKEAGFKVCYHLMPGLPLMDNTREQNTYQTLFSDHRFQPDMLKIYPTLIIKGTTLYRLWKQGTYTPLSTSKASTLIARIKQYIPPYVRIQRIQRDIPAPLISGGVTKSNLRQIVTNELQQHGTTCPCIRCREIGHKNLAAQNMLEPADIKLCRHDYQASSSTEIFLSYEDPHKNLLLGYLRLRNIAESHRWELQQKPCMIIRELKILGQELPVGEHNPLAVQHKGYGHRLIQEAERICLEEFQKKHLYVLSGIGVIPYYKKLGFKTHGIYLRKQLYG